MRSLKKFSAQMTGFIAFGESSVGPLSGAGGFAAPNSAAPDDFQDLKLGAKALRWLTRNGITRAMLDEVFLNHVFAKKLTEFNEALAKNPDKKMKVITIREDFQELKEDKIIEVSRAAGIITNDVQKILKDGLGTRNSAGHPSDVKIQRTKVISLIDDLVTNVIKKF